jgi:hypothetical protein
MGNNHVVLVEGDSILRQLLGQTLEQAGFQVSRVANTHEGRLACHRLAPVGVVVDLATAGAMSPAECASALRSVSPEAGLVFLSDGGMPEVHAAIAGLDGQTVCLDKADLFTAEDVLVAINSVVPATY